LRYARTAALDRLFKDAPPATLMATEPDDKISLSAPLECFVFGAYRGQRFGLEQDKPLVHLIDAPVNK
jgi:hypothetical protein